MTKYQRKTRFKKRRNGCDKKLEDFGRKHYTYINSFLGDQTVRDIIVNDVKPYDDKKYALYVEHTNDNFEPENITWSKNFDKNFNYLNRKNGRRFKG